MVSSANRKSKFVESVGFAKYVEYVGIKAAPKLLNLSPKHHPHFLLRTIESGYENPMPNGWLPKLGKVSTVELLDSISKFIRPPPC